MSLGQSVGQISIISWVQHYSFVFGHIQSTLFVWENFSEAAFMVGNGSHPGRYPPPYPFSSFGLLTGTVLPLPKGRTVAIQSHTPIAPMDSYFLFRFQLSLKKACFSCLYDVMIEMYLHAEMWDYVPIIMRLQHVQGHKRIWHM